MSREQSMLNIKLASVLFLISLLAACGGGGAIGETKPGFGQGESDGSGANPNSPQTLGSNTFFPLNFYYSGEGYVEKDEMDYFLFHPLTQAYLVSPVDSRTLKPASAPKLSDFELKINGTLAENDEYIPVFQKIVGLPVQLHTALIVDTSSSTQSVEKTALINEIMQFVQKAQANSDPVIKNQLFSLWAFGGEVKPLLTEFTRSSTDIRNALDAINWEGQGVNSALYQSIVAAVGVYKGAGSNDLTEELNYLYVNPKDDQSGLSQVLLFDGFVSDNSFVGLSQLNLSNLVLFGSGGNTSAYFDEEAAKTALNWQSLLVFDEELEIEDGSQNDQEDQNNQEQSQSTDPLEGMIHSGKPLYYVSVGLNGVPEGIQSIASLTIDTQATTAFNFSQQLINKQIADVKKRSRLDNAYLLRFPIFERDGKTTSVLSSRTNYRDYWLSNTLEFKEPDTTTPEPSAQLEITGPNNEYLAGGSVKASQVSKLYPGVRWDFWNNYQSGYSWTVGGVARPIGADGSISITAADAGKTVVVTVGGLTASIEVE